MAGEGRNHRVDDAFGYQHAAAKTNPRFYPVQVADFDPALFVLAQNLLDEYVGLTRQRESAGRNRHPVFDKSLDSNVQSHQFVFHLYRLPSCTPLKQTAFSSR